MPRNLKEAGGSLSGVLCYRGQDIVQGASGVFDRDAQGWTCSLGDARGARTQASTHFRKRQTMISDGQVMLASREKICSSRNNV